MLATPSITATSTSTTTTNPIKKTPSDYLKTVLGRPVSIKLVNGIVYKGILACLDGYLNVALEQCIEIDLKGQTRNYGDAFIRGNNISYISAQQA
jgi:U6 snRNA-associated Sm-like protein LSm6